MSESMAKYPRALPHRPPVEETDLEARRERSRAEPRLSVADLAALEARMRLRLFLVILSSAAILVVMGLIGVFYVNQAVRRAGSVAAAPSVETPPLVKQEASRPEPTASAATIPAVRNDRTAEVLGGLTAANLHQAYLNIGLLADAAENDVYSVEEARKILETVTSLTDAVDQQLKQVPESLLDTGDQKKLARARQVVGLLRTEAKRLLAYWDTPEAEKEKKMEREAAFHEVRKAAWEGIKELLQLDD